MKAIASFVLLSVLALLAVAHFDVRSAQADTFGSGANTFDIQFVTIDNPGNAADATGAPNPAGSVGYIYNIGKFEISEQMIDKANALGSLGITKLIRGPDKPATQVSWNEGARFVNWLNTSTGSPPAYKFAIQPGNVGYSANSIIQLWSVSDAGYNPNNPYRNNMARYVLPTVDEWYKAAYYDPVSGVYYDYATGSNTAPTSIFSGTAVGTAVYGLSNPINPLHLPADVTLAGGLSPSGTMGQGGNAYEWEETDFDLVNDGASNARGVRGGAWDDNLASFSVLSSLIRKNGTASFEYLDVGFRIASSVPEPSTILLAIAAFANLLTVRRKSVPHDRV